MNTHLTVRAWTFSHSLALTSLCTSTCLTYCLLNRSEHLQFVNSHCATPMLCIIALLLLLSKSKSPCKSFSHLCEPFFPGHILFHWKVWGPPQGNHASAIGEVCHSFTQVAFCWLTLLFIYKGKVELDITGSSVSVCHPVALPADLSLSRLWLATSSNWILRAHYTEQTN